MGTFSASWYVCVPPPHFFPRKEVYNREENSCTIFFFATCCLNKFQNGVINMVGESGCSAICVNTKQWRRHWMRGSLLPVDMEKYHRVCIAWDEAWYLKLVLSGCTLHFGISLEKPRFWCLQLWLGWFLDFLIFYIPRDLLLSSDWPSEESCKTDSLSCFRDF